MRNDTIVTNGANIFTLLGVPNFSKNTPKMRVKRSLKPSRLSTSDLKKFMSEKNIVYWGEDNLLPQNVKEKAAQIPLLLRALKFRSQAHYGMGLQLYKEEGIEGKLVKTPIVNESFEDFSYHSNLTITQQRLISDWEWFRNIFIEIILNKEGTKIVKINRLNAMFCRYEKLSDDTQQPGYLYYSSKWGCNISDTEIKKIPILDWDSPIEDLQDEMRRKSRLRRFILPIKIEELDHIYFDWAFWTSILDSWGQVSAQIPFLKQALMKNQMVLKFHIKIPYSYWTNKYKDWNNPSVYDDDKRRKIIADTLDEMNSFLTDTDNYGKSFISHYGADPMNPTKTSEEWKIEPLDNTKLLADGAHTTDAKTANGEIVTAVGVDPTLLGGFLPGGSEAGSGSNKREAFNILQAELFPDRQITTYWFEHVKRFNQWPQEWRIGYKNLETQTLNENPTGTKTTLS